MCLIAAFVSKHLFDCFDNGILKNQIVDSSAWHSSSVDSSLLMQRQTIDFTPRLFQWSLRNISPHSPHMTIEGKVVIVAVAAFLAVGDGLDHSPAD